MIARGTLIASSSSLLVWSGAGGAGILVPRGRGRQGAGASERTGGGVPCLASTPALPVPPGADARAAWCLLPPARAGGLGRLNARLSPAASCRPAPHRDAHYRTHPAERLESLNVSACHER